MPWEEHVSDAKVQPISPQGPYEPPRVEVLGTLQDLTLGAAGTVFDGFLFKASV